MALALAHTRFGEAGPPMLILHGLMGSGRNWHGIAQALAEHFQIAVPDLRNHGASPHADAMDYPSMADDLQALLDQLQWPKVRLIGHSMGGKLAMYLAMHLPKRVVNLLVVDIAPVAYPDQHTSILDAMAALPLAEIHSRRDADSYLAVSIPDVAVRQLLLQNLVSGEQGYRWRLNLAALRANLSTLLLAPPLKQFLPYPGETLFLAGERSNYIQPEHQPIIGHCFPQAHIRVLLDAGHWPHADQPEAFIRVVREFNA